MAAGKRNHSETMPDYRIRLQKDEYFTNRKLKGTLFYRGRVPYRRADHE